MLKIIFRADGNSSIGWGHVMRSISIASAYTDQGNKCIFVCADNSMVDIIKSYGFRTVVLNSDYTKMIDELPVFLRLIDSEKPDLIFFDSYFVNYEYLNNFKGLYKTVYIDDVFSFPYPVDYLINYNIYATKDKYEKLYEGNDIPLLCLNIKYAPLRKEFRDIEKEFSDTVRNVFISVGGSDEYRLVMKIIKSLSAEKELISNRYYHFILGSFEPDRGAILNIADNHEWICIHEKVKNMVDVMKNCDVAVSAAGSTLYELCACRVPTITFVLADNQKGGAKGFQDNGLMLDSGDIRKNNYGVDNIINGLKHLCNDNSLRKSLFDRMNDLVDGYGAENIVNQITVNKCVSF